MDIARSDINPVSSSEALNDVLTSDIQLYCRIALATVMAYDIIIEMDKEVKYFWKPLNFNNSIYFLNRYIGLSSAFLGVLGSSYNTSDTLCLVTTWVKTLADCLTLLLIDYILLMRILAIYSQPKKISVFLRALFVIDALITVGAVTYWTAYERPGVDVDGHVKGFATCEAARRVSPIWEILPWIMTLAFELILMILALLGVRSIWSSSASSKSRGLLPRVLIQHQVLYFTLVALFGAINIVACVRWPQDNKASVYVNVLASPTLLCVFGSRLLIQLKEVGEKGLSRDVSLVTRY